MGDGKDEAAGEKNNIVVKEALLYMFCNYWLINNAAFGQ